jgi:hypothetical protein
MRNYWPSSLKIDVTLTGFTFQVRKLGFTPLRSQGFVTDQTARLDPRWLVLDPSLVPALLNRLLGRKARNLCLPHGGARGSA